MKPKLKKKYRLLRPNEKIRYGDWFNAASNSSSAHPEGIKAGNADSSYENGGKGGWIQIQEIEYYSHMIGHTPNDDSLVGLVFARYNL